MVALFKLDSFVTSCAAVVYGFQRGRCAAHYQGCSLYAGHHCRHISSVVARSRGVLFVGTVVFFVYDDQPEFVMRQEEGAPCAQDYVGFTVRPFRHQ